MSRYEELEKLAKLREQGILTDEEFQVQKKKILEENTHPSPPAPPEKKNSNNVLLILALCALPLIIGAIFWFTKSGSTTASSELADSTQAAAKLDSILTSLPNQPEQQQTIPLTDETIRVAVDEAIIRQLRRSELDGTQMKQGTKRQVERGDLNGDGKDDVAALFSLITVGTETFTEYLVIFLNDGNGSLQLSADRLAGVDDQAQGSEWNLKGIAGKRILVTVHEWGPDDEDDDTAQVAPATSVKELQLKNGRLVEIQ